MNNRQYWQYVVVIGMVIWLAVPLRMSVECPDKFSLVVVGLGCIDRPWFAVPRLFSHVFEHIFAGGGFTVYAGDLMMIIGVGVLSGLAAVLLVTVAGVLKKALRK